VPEQTIESSDEDMEDVVHEILGIVAMGDEILGIGAMGVEKEAVLVVTLLS